jgi:hypothetical protein
MIFNSTLLPRNCKVQDDKLGMIFIKHKDDIRFINEQTLTSILISANIKLKNPKWCIAGFIVILVRITDMF